MSDPVINTERLNEEISRYVTAVQTYEAQRESMRCTLSALAAMLVDDMNGDANLKITTTCAAHRGILAFDILLDAKHALYGEFGAAYSVSYVEIARAVDFVSNLRGALKVRIGQIQGLIDTKRRR